MTFSYTADSRSPSFAGRSAHASPLVFLVCACFVSGLGACLGCGAPPPPPPKIPAQPKIVSERTDTNFFANNQEHVQVKNEGEAGMVECTVYWVETETTTTVERGESGAEKALRETFTRQVEPPPQEKVKYATRLNKSWTLKKMMQKGETTEFLFDLEGHSSMSGHLKVRVCGLPQ